MKNIRWAVSRGGNNNIARIGFISPKSAIRLRFVLHIHLIRVMALDFDDTGFNIGVFRDGRIQSKAVCINLAVTKVTKLVTMVL